MPRYFIDIGDGLLTIKDHLGEEFSGDDAARAMAMALLSDLARDALPLRDAHSFFLIVRDAAGAVLFKATLTLNDGWITDAPN